ncbi:uncharacterized protein EV422DRAFT_562794 [Fimicolochytrium jonesii]|uniref:uncharacterized protein n=1 Tax=Fimicolochytrium jonesii TaxID=1396493 RepID=UPI0022FE8851|nr:uncharacterized protein EV422DRAFT_562794 [Fimicolochytrium jonesii]KAI8826741.1 hypothetical protein EV422DRAFT_562794 [Fimicolochytrium jonesii]
MAESRGTPGSFTLPLPSARQSLLDFPPGISPSPLVTIATTPNRFVTGLTPSSNLEAEPNPFEFSFSAQQQGKRAEPPSGSGFASSPNPILPPLIPTSRAPDNYGFRTGFTPGPGGMGMLTPLSATLASLGLPLHPNPSQHISLHDPHHQHQHHQQQQHHHQHPLPSHDMQPHRPMEFVHPAPRGPVAHVASDIPRGMVPPAYNYQDQIPHQQTVPMVAVHPGLPQNIMPDPTQQYSMSAPHQHPQAMMYMPPDQHRPPYLSEAPHETMRPDQSRAAYEPTSPQVAAAALLDMRNDTDRSRKPVPPTPTATQWLAEELLPNKQSAARKSDTKTSKKRGRGHEMPAAETVETPGRPSKSSSSKRHNNGGTKKKADSEPSKTSGSSSKGDGEEGEKSDDDMDPEEKRKTFLERNRQAALKCRQKKKQWLQSLQAKVDHLTDNNGALQSQATQLREEILNLKTLLLAHRDCPVAKQNGLDIAAIESALPISSIQPYPSRMY